LVDFVTDSKIEENKDEDVASSQNTYDGQKIQSAQIGKE
jgi:hypothetical protein